MFCSICESIHDISLMEEERETIIKGEKIKYKELYYKCPKYQNNNIFMSGDLWNINLINSLDEYRKKKDLLTSKEIKEITIKKDVVDPDDVEMLQDLILTCVNEALRKVDSAQAASMGKYNIPGMM